MPVVRATYMVEVRMSQESTSINVAHAGIKDGKGNKRRPGKCKTFAIEKISYVDRQIRKRKFRNR